MQLTGIIAPPVAGAAIALVGTGAAFAVDSASFFVAAAIVLMISASGAPARSGVPAPSTHDAPGAVALDEDPPAAGEGSFAAQLREGIAYVVADPALRMVLLISLVMNFALGGPNMVGMPWLAEVRFDAGPVGLGMLTAGYAIGALAGTALAGNTSVTGKGRRLIGALGASGLGLLVIAVAPSIWIVFGALAVMGLVIGYTNIVALSWLQGRVEPAMVGRVMAITMLMGFGTTPLSFAVSGALLDVNATAMFAGAAAIVLATTALALVSGFAARFDAAAPGAEAVATGTVAGTTIEPAA